MRMCLCLVNISGVVSLVSGCWFVPFIFLLSQRGRARPGDSNCGRDVSVVHKVLEL